MNHPITLPTPDEIAQRIRACREELAALKKLERIARTAQAACHARERRQEVTQPTTDAMCESKSRGRLPGPEDRAGAGSLPGDAAVSDAQRYIAGPELADHGLTIEDVRRRCPHAVEYRDLDGRPCWVRNDLAELCAPSGGGS